MRFANIKNHSGTSGKLALVSHDGLRATSAASVAPTLLYALQNWERLEPSLRKLADNLETGNTPEVFNFVERETSAPLPNAAQWCDGSAFLSHGRLLEQAFKVPPIENFESVPLMYQGATDDFLGPYEDALFLTEDDEIDFEGEFGVVTTDVPMGCSPEEALSYIKLIVMINDWSLRKFGPREMKSGFGFIHSKPSTSFSPLAVTTDELGEAWLNGRVHLSLDVVFNGQPFGSPHGSEMHFSFGDLIAHAARTRKLKAGTIIGSGTVSNSNYNVGSACIAERRMIEIVSQGSAKTNYMRFGDSVEMKSLDRSGRCIFGSIKQRVAPASPVV